MIAMSRNAAIEWGKKGVRVNTVIPGVFLTPPTLGLMPDEEPQAADLVNNSMAFLQPC